MPQRFACRASHVGHFLCLTLLAALTGHTLALQPLWMAARQQTIGARLAAVQARLAARPHSRR